ncbi:MAG: 5-(carboxyamino)imidazole ribonucleotide synthase [Elsteraceae bacterium]
MLAPGSLAPGGRIGVLGGGQLGRMTALAAASLGFRTHVYSEHADDPAAQVATAHTAGDFNDMDALARFAAEVDVVTYEFENIPVEPVQWLAERLPVRPSPRVLRISQDRLREKDFLGRLKIPTTFYRAVNAFPQLINALGVVGKPAVLKSTRMGYDGKGQVAIDDATDPSLAWRQIGATVGILERFVDFEYEASVLVARRPSGEVSVYEPVRNLHRHHILAETHVPAPMSAALSQEARRIAASIAEALELEGLLCVEMFVTRNGELVVNELAPRPHNSGHWTMDACVTSQFEQTVRAICDLPLGSTERLADAVMLNLIGDDVHQWRSHLDNPRAKLHLYGKREARPGRKMGHVTILTPRGD